MSTVAREIVEQVNLCDAQGCLNSEAVGWSRQPLHVCNLKGRFPRKKKWDYWCVVGEKFLFSATVANVDYMGLAAVYLLEYAERTYAEQATVQPLSAQPRMPEMIGGSTPFTSRKLDVSIDDAGEAVEITARAENVNGTRLTADITIEHPTGLESLNVVVPWNSRTFQYTSKQHCLPAHGTITWGDRKFVFKRDRAFAIRDLGRGIWPYRTAWNWAAFSAQCGEDAVGLNLGAKWTDGTGMNENGIILNGILHKVHSDALLEYDIHDFMKPWRLRTKSTDEVDLELTPFYERAQTTNLLILRSEAHQVFGRYNGTLRADGRTVHVRDVVGWAEEHIARWQKQRMQ